MMGEQDRLALRGRPRIYISFWSQVYFSLRPSVKAVEFVKIIRSSRLNQNQLVHFVVFFLGMGGGGKEKGNM